jgi:hypothetical protein
MLITDWNMPNMGGLECVAQLFDDPPATDQTADQSAEPMDLMRTLQRLLLPEVAASA